MNPVLTTSRLLLRPPQTGDAEAIALYLNDFDVAGNLARVPYPYYLSDAQAWLRTRQPDMPADRVNFAIEMGGTYMGQVGFYPGTEGPVIGYWLGKPFWGRGIMSEAAAASLDWFFRTTGAPRVLSGVFHFNAASMAIQTRLGFVETGRSRLLCLARGVEVEHIDTELTHTAWKATKP